ncbi:MAG TPA: cytidylate kinase-like family protein [Verrucomicrobiota bacterium]|nr:cytidylate kinase-like family protein [Verrucomicrobiota bacterium]
MNQPANVEQCYSFVNLQLQPRDGKSYAEKVVAHPRAVTLSRQAGCGALEVAEKLARLLQARSPKDAPPWTVFDQNLMEKVLEDHQLSGRFARFLPEDRMTELQDIVDELFGLRPASWTVIQDTAETMLKLADVGSVILIGRGSNIVTSKLDDTFHVRLVAPLDQRVERAHRNYNMSLKEAREFCKREDLGRERYLKKYFKADVNDPMHYHMILNTGMLSCDEAAKLIADAAVAHTPRYGSHG